MLSSYGWLIWNITRRLWFRATLISLMAVAAAFAAFGLAPYLPEDLPAKVGVDAVHDILNILASSLLIVTTFSLSTMVAAYSAAGVSAPPRATRLLLQDTHTQNVLATFVGSFLYSLVAIITLATGIYGEAGRLVLFVVTLLVVILITVTLLRWIDYLLRLARVGETARQVEEAATRAMRQRAARPSLGGRAWSGEAQEIPSGAVPVFPRMAGYVQNIDIRRLGRGAAETGGEVLVAAAPGSFVDPGRPIAYATGKADARQRAGMSAAFAIGKERTFEQDPAHGLGVLSEIASRALSPGVNDPGTALDVIGSALRVLLVRTEDTVAQEPEIEAVRITPVSARELFDAFFTPVARDGQAFVEVQMRLQDAFAALLNSRDPAYREQALRHSRLALRRAEAGLAFEPDREAVLQAHRGALATARRSD